DWDREHPASGIRNLYAGRYRILEEFKKHGVDVTSEGLRYPYVGKISMCWYAGGPSPCPFGGKPVPMLPLIYRKSAVWGRASNRAIVWISTGRRKGTSSLWMELRWRGTAQHSVH